MPDTTLEEARRCFKCGEPGELVKEMPRPRGEKVHIYKCSNERCQYFDQTVRVVQIKADGTIPTRKPGAKEFPNPERMKNLGSSYLEYLKHEIDGGETRGPV